MRSGIMRLLLLGTLLSAGCAFPGYEEMADADCRSYGAAPGTDGYVQCMATRVAALEASDQAALASLAQVNATNALIASQLAPPYPYTQPVRIVP